MAFMRAASHAPRSFHKGYGLIGVAGFVIFYVGVVWELQRRKRNRREFLLKLNPLAAERVKDHIRG